MTAKLISGNEIAQQIREELKKEVTRLKETHKVVPGLVTLLVGENPASVSYVTDKQKTSKDLGFYSIQDNQPESITENQLLKLIDQYNQDPKIHGILVQLPLPKHINETRVLNAIDPKKEPRNPGRGPSPTGPHWARRRSQWSARTRAAMASTRGTARGRTYGSCRPFARSTVGSPAVVMAFPEAGFSYTKGKPKAFRRSDLPSPVTREFCGECVEICPVGALTTKLFKYKGRTWNLDRTTSVCNYCGCGCRTSYESRLGRIVRVRSAERNYLCGKGRFGWDAVHHPDRLTTLSCARETAGAISGRDPGSPAAGAPSP